MSTSIEKTYHHGDLRTALVSAALRLLEAADGTLPSLRAVAREAGVSATAVYRHFADKDALLAAIAGEGLAMLGAAQRTASDSAGGGERGFAATGAAYVRFALAHPVLFRLIFQHPAPPGLMTDEGGRQPNAMALLRANAAALAPAGTDPQVFALQAWSLAHGLAMLMLDRQIPADDATITAVVDMAALR